MRAPMAIDNKLIDQLLVDYKKPEDIIGEDGLLKQLTKAILERALKAELGRVPRPCFLLFVDEPAERSR